MNPILIDVNQAAEQFGVCAATVRRWCRERRIAGVRYFGKTIRIHIPTFNAWCEDGSPSPVGEWQAEYQTKQEEARLIHKYGEKVTA